MQGGCGRSLLAPGGGSLARAGEEKFGEIIAQISARQRHALIVVDDALSRRTIADALAERGFEVLDKVLGPEMIAQASDAALARKRLERASS